MKKLKTPLLIGFVLFFALNSCEIGGGGNFGSPRETAILQQVFQSLETSNRQQSIAHNIFFQRLQMKFSDQEKADGVPKDHLAMELRNMNKNARNLQNYLSRLKETLFEMAGEHEIGLENPGELVKNQEFWDVSSENEGRGSGEAYFLREKVNGFVVSVNQIRFKLESGKSMETFGPIAVDPKDDLNFPPNHPDKGKTWESFNFEGNSVISNLVTIATIESKALTIEAEMLDFIEKYADPDARIAGGKLRLISSPKSNVVAAGMKFETKIYVTSAIGLEQSPEFRSSGNVQTTDNGMAAIMSMTAAGGFARGTNEKEVSYSVVAKVPKADGSSEELNLNETFTVRKPDVVVKSTSVQNLYFHCENTLNIDVPSLGEYYNPKITASEAQLLPSKTDKREFSIVPSGKVCFIGVSSISNGQNIKVDDLKYHVIKPPKPTIQLLVDRKEYGGMFPIPKSSNLKLTIRPVSDFRSSLPKDARYYVDKVDLRVQKGSGSATIVKTFKGSESDGITGVEMSLAENLKDVASGTICFLEIGNVYRVNFQNKKILEPFSDREKVLAFIVK